MQRRQSQTMPPAAEIPTVDPVVATPLPSFTGVLTLAEVARELRCSKAHVHNLINGKVQGARPLHALRLGRRRLVRRSSLEEWIALNERCYDPIRPEFIAVGARKD
jgi:excisionase family DNA binding protein